MALGFRWGTPAAGSGGAIPLRNCDGQFGFTRKRRCGDLSFTVSSNFVLALQLTYVDCASGAKLCEPHRSLVVPPASGATTDCALSLIIAVLAGGRSSLTSQSVSRSRDPGDVPESLKVPPPPQRLARAYRSASAARAQRECSASAVRAQRERSASAARAQRASASARGRQYPKKASRARRRARSRRRRSRSLRDAGPSPRRRPLPGGRRVGNQFGSGDRPALSGTVTRRPCHISSCSPRSSSMTFSWQAAARCPT